MTTKDKDLKELLAQSDQNSNEIIDAYEIVEAQYISAYATGSVFPASSNTTGLPLSTISATPFTR